MAKSYDGSVDVAMPPDAAFHTLHQAIGSITKPESLQVNGWDVTATVGISMKSWGEHIAGRVLVGPGGTRVEVTSECRWKTTLFDYGKNRKNVESILAHFAPPAG